MARPQTADPVKLFVGILWSQPRSLQDATEDLVRTWDEIDFTGADHRFDSTDYYEAEMGGSLQRRLVSFRRLVPPDILIGAKHICNEIEGRLAGPAGEVGQPGCRLSGSQQGCACQFQGGRPEDISQRWGLGGHGGSLSCGSIFAVRMDLPGFSRRALRPGTSSNTPSLPQPAEVKTQGIKRKHVERLSRGCLTN